MVNSPFVVCLLNGWWVGGLADARGGVGGVGGVGEGGRPLPGRCRFAPFRLAAHGWPPNTAPIQTFLSSR
jgi:hypothetical protein